MWPSNSKWLSEQSNVSSSDFALSLNNPLWKLFGWFRRLQLWATGNWQLHHDNACVHSCITSRAEIFGETSNHSGDSAPYIPDLVNCNFWLFLKLKNIYSGKRFQTIDEIQENTTGELMANGGTVWGPKLPTLKGTEASLFYVQCFLSLLQ